MKNRTSRRQFLRALTGAAAALPLARALPGWAAPPAGHAQRIIIFYFPDGVVGPSQNGDSSKWHCTGSEYSFSLSELLQPLAPFKDDCVFLNGLTMGGTDSGSHPGGAKKLLTGVDGGNGESIDRFIARTIAADAPHKMIYLGAQANHNNASGDKHISYISPGVTVTPEDNPMNAFSSLFSGAIAGVGGASGPDPFEVGVIDGLLEDMAILRNSLGTAEKSKLDIHLDSLNEVEKRIKATPEFRGASCESPVLDTGELGVGNLYAPELFPTVLRAQMDLTVQAMACGLTRVATIQASHHTSELIMSRFEGTPMHAPNFDMRSHQASHYGTSHDLGKKEYAEFRKQRIWWVEQFAWLLDALKSRPEGDGTMLDHSLVLLATEVCDGNTHLHDNMPLVLAGQAGGKLSTGRLLQTNGTHHSNLLLSLAHAMGEYAPNFGYSNGPLSGLLS